MTLDPRCDVVTRLPTSTEIGVYKKAIRSDPCSYCDAPSEELDHLHPASKGGSGRWTNLVPSCARCNRLKGARTLLGFLGYLAHRERLDKAITDRVAWGGLGA